MGSILCIETSSKVCSVAIGRDGRIDGCRESELQNAHSTLLTDFISETVRESGQGFSGIDAVAVSMGPGSYTGLRIGVATAKGLCFSLGKPLIAIPTLTSMAYGMRLKHTEDADMFCPMLDARRMEVYTAVFGRDLALIRDVAAEIITQHSFDSLLETGRILFAGEGAGKCRPLIGSHRNAFFDDGFRLSASYLYPLAEESFRLGKFENPAYFEPFYLKDFIPGKPKVKGL